MSRISTAIITVLSSALFAGCAQPGSTVASSPSPTPAPPDLTGEWEEINPPKDSWYEATISRNTIEVLEVSSDDKKEVSGKAPLFLRLS